METPIQNLAVEALKFVGTSATVATLGYLWIRSLQNRLQETREQLKQCRKARHEEKDEMIEEMERDVELMENLWQNSNSDDNLS